MKMEVYLHTMWHMSVACGCSAVMWLQACSGAGKNEEAVKGMEQLCEVKAQAAGPSVVHTVQTAGVSLEARLQVPHSGSSQPSACS